ncbi:recQ [Mytilus edulis]|uniref:RecQ n=1 Tax=Mytilus edulis TaxID=6550 RepID=A0A8S3UFB5_MYTED|nr:recQ [Mytilus edulis]
MLQSILRKLYIQDPIIESLCPDRPNIFLKYKSEPGMEPLVEIKWYLDEIKEKGVMADKAILYVRSVTAVGTLFRDIMGNLRDDGYKDRTKRFQNRLVGEFHGALEDHDQKKILCSFLKPESPVRLLICTVAFGLGVNIQTFGMSFIGGHVTHYYSIGRRLVVLEGTGNHLWHIIMLLGLPSYMWRMT